MQNNILDQKDIMHTTHPSLEPESNTLLEPESNTSLEPESNTSLEPESNTLLEPESNDVNQPPNQIEIFIKDNVKILYYIIYGLSWGNISINPYKSTYNIKFVFCLIIFIIILLSTGYGATSILSKIYGINDKSNDDNDDDKSKENTQTISNYIINQIKLFRSDTYNLFIKNKITIPTIPDLSLNDLSFNDLSFNDLSFNVMEKTKYNKEYLKIYNKNMIRLVVLQLIGFILIFFILIFTMIYLNNNINKNDYNFFDKIPPIPPIPPIQPE